MANPRKIHLGLVSMLFVGCAAPGALEPMDDAPPPTTTPPPAPSIGPAVDCPVLSSAGPAVAAGFDHLTSGALGEPRHELDEPVVRRGDAVRLNARFRYGLVSKDLEDEEVTAYARLETCSEWTALGTGRTDDDGMFALDLAPALFDQLGAYDVEIVAHGDLSRARGHVFVVPDGQPSVVFDIDGTLTTSDSELFSELYDGVPAEMYEGGPDVAHRYAEAGYFIVYLSGRPHMLQEMSRAWLEAHDFPIGPVITSDHALEASGPLVRVHKREHLTDLIDRAGLEFPFAYGNATTDICAYLDVGIDPASTFIIGPHAGESCDGGEPTVAIDSYTSHMSQLSDLPPAF
jgi:phosphatidate phosphatase PAH1